MKITAGRKLLLSVIFVLLFFSGVCNGGDLPLLQVATDTEKEGGALVELTVTAFKRAGYRVIIQYLPWKRALEKGLAGDFDMILGAYYTRERERLLAYSHPIGKLELCLVKRKGENIHFSSLADLKPYRIGHIRGAAVNPEFDRAARTFLNIEYVSILEYNIRKLLNYRIDLLVDKRFMVQKIVREKYPDSIGKIEFLSPPLQCRAFYNAFPRSRYGFQHNLRIFNDALEELQEDGTMADIFRRHGLEQMPDSVINVEMR
jgi:polar amino acid transport system substrate-binding protein